MTSSSGRILSARRLSQLLFAGQMAEAGQWLEGRSSLEIRDELERLSAPDMAVAFRLLAKDKALKVFEKLEPPAQRRLLTAMREEELPPMVASLAPDDLAELFDEMPAKVASRLLEGLPESQQEAVARVLGYPAESAGRLMVPTPVVLSADDSRRAALDKLQGSGMTGDIAVVPVGDNHRVLAGTVSLAALVAASDSTQVQDVMHRETHSVRASVDQEEAARLMQEADMFALPVVDDEDRILGLITMDDAMEVLEFEVTEDAYRAGGSEPLQGHYLTASVMTLVRRRGVWLLVLIAAAFLTINVMELFESTLEAVVALSVFVPMIIGTGGNAGAQAASSVVRALAVAEVHPADALRVIWREARVGLLLGAALGGALFPIVTLLYDTTVAATVCITIIAICGWACIVGGLLPLVAKKLGVDPAVFSTPVVSTLVDATGLIIYFTVAGTVMADQIAAATGS